MKEACEARELAPAPPPPPCHPARMDLKPAPCVGVPQLEEVLGSGEDRAPQPPFALGGGRGVQDANPDPMLPTDLVGDEDEVHVLGEDWDM